LKQYSGQTFANGDRDGVDKKPLIFCHIPKTAGTSMRYVLFPDDYKRHPKEDIYIGYDNFIRKNVDFYNRHGWMTLQRWINWEDRYTYPYSKEEFDFGFLHIPNVDFLEYWLYMIPHGEKTKLIELHLNKDPRYNDDGTITYNHEISLPHDLCSNKMYHRFDWLTLLRDPAERLISEFYFIGNTMPVESHKAPLHTVTRFWGHLPTKAVESLEGYNEAPNTHNTQVKWLLGKGFLGEYEVTENDCDMLIERMEELDFKVGVQDRMVDSIKYFNKSLDLNLDIYNIPRRRDMSSTKPFVSEKTKDKIRKNNKWDIKLYNYFSEKLV
jgi:hypothetical protein